jgi:hypothetical protein
VKLVTFGERRLFLGDEAADALTRYAATLAARGAADAVTLNVIGSDGHAVAATLVLNQGVALSAESAAYSFEEPDNTDAVAYMVQETGVQRARTSNTLTQQEVDEYRDFFGEI